MPAQPKNIRFDCTAKANDCRGYVLARRESQTGWHFCPNPSCQSVKQRLYRQRREANSNISEAAQFAIFVRAAISQRTLCDSCKRPDGIVGYVHPIVTDGLVTGSCSALGGGGGLFKAALMAAYADAPMASQAKIEEWEAADRAAEAKQKVERLKQRQQSARGSDF